MRYCTYCGKQIEDDEVCSCAGAQKNSVDWKKKLDSKPPSGKIKKWAIPVTIVLVVVIAIICIVSFKQSEIDLAEYIIVKEVKGLNGQGVLSYSLDTSALNKVLIGEEDYSDMNEDNYEEIMSGIWEEYDLAGKAVKCITLTASQETNLVNGDTVTIMASFENANNDKFPYHFKDGAIKYTVSGLLEGKTVDPFTEEYLTVSFSGFNGQGEANMETLTEEDPISLFSYQLSQTTGLTNGDSVIVTAKVNETALQELGYFIPETMEKTYSVSGLGEYFDIADGLPAEVLEELCEIALSESKQKEEASVADDYILTAPSKICGACFIQVEDASNVHTSWKNDVEINNAAVVITSYSVEYPGLFGFTRDYMLSFVFPNFSVDSNGNLSYQEESIYGHLTWDDTLEKVLEDLQEEYDDMCMVNLTLPDQYLAVVTEAVEE